MGWAVPPPPPSHTNWTRLVPTPGRARNLEDGQELGLPPEVRVRRVVRVHAPAVEHAAPEPPPGIRQPPPELVRARLVPVRLALAAPAPVCPAACGVVPLR